MPPSAPIGDKKNIVKMAYIYFQEGRWDKAIEEYKKLLKLDPDDINTHNMLGDVYVKKGSLREAYDEYVRVGNELTSRGQGDKAAVVNKKIAALDSALLTPEAKAKQNLIKRTLKAEVAMEQGDYQTAIDALGEVLKSDPDNISIYSKLAELLVAKGKTSEAIQQYAVMGAAYQKNRLYKKAQEAFQKILELDPNQVEARINLAQIYIKQGSESDAKKEFLTVAEIYLRQGDLDKAQVYARKSVELKGIEAYYILGQTLFKKKQFGEAKTEFDNLLRFKVNHVGGLTHLGLVYLELNQLDKAAEQFAKAQKIEKDNPKILEALAELNLKKGAKDEAEALFIQVATWYLGKKDHKKALEIARKAEAADNQSPQVMKLLGEALQEDGQKAEAARTFLKAADLFEKKGQNEIAEPIRKKAKELEESATPSTSAPAPATVPAPSTSAPVPAAVPTPQTAEILAPVEPAPPAAEAPKPTPSETPKPEPVAAEAPESSDEPEAAAKQGEVAVPSVSSQEAIVEKEAVEAPSDRVLDLDEEPEVKVEASKSEPPTPTASEKSAEQALDRETELHSQLEIAGDYIKQNMVEDAIEIYQQLLENYPEHPEVRSKLNDAYTLYVKGGDEVIENLEAEQKAKEDEEKRLREERDRRVKEERKVKEELELKAKEEQDRKAREEQEIKAKAELERKTKEDAERRVREEAELRAREEALQKARTEIERKAKAEAERLLREELEKKVKAEAEQKIREEMDRRAKENEERRLREEKERNAKEEAERLLQEELGKRAKEEAERRLREELSQKMKEEAERKLRKESERMEREEAEKKHLEEIELKKREEDEKAKREQEIRNRAEETPRMGSGVPDATKSARLTPSDDSRDEFMTIAVADIYVRQGLYDEAQRIYGRIIDTEPDNYEAKKKLSDLESMMKAKGMQLQAAASAPSAPVSTPSASVKPKSTSEPVEPEPAKAQEVVPPPEKEPVAKKKHGKVGYV
jgi:tetratricopeptide (TPR) repeat protein